MLGGAPPTGPEWEWVGAPHAITVEFVWVEAVGLQGPVPVARTLGEQGSKTPGLSSPDA